VSQEPTQQYEHEATYKYKYKYQFLAQHTQAEDDGKRDEHGQGERKPGDDAEDKSQGTENAHDKDKDKKNDEGKDKDEKKDDPKAKRKKLMIFGGLAVLFLLLGVIWLLLYLFVFSKRQTTDDAYVGGDQVAIASKIAGTVIDVSIDDTEPVHAGQVLIRLDPADAGADLIRAEGLLAQSVRQVQQQIHSAGQADAVIAARQADVDKANDDYRRRQPLLAEHATAAEDVTNALQQLRSARAALEQAQRQAHASHALVDGVDVNNNPGVIQARAQYITAWVNNSRNTIIAPIDGYAAQREVQIGQQVAPGQRLLTVVPLERLWVDANFKEGQLDGIRIGQPAEVRADMYPSDVIFHGHVVGLAAGTGGAFALLPPQNASGNWIKIVQRLPVRIGLDPNELRAHPLRIGLSTYTKVDIHDRSGTVLATAARLTPLSATAVYNAEFERAAQAADQIITRNLVGTAAAASPDH
jgi:membrane fusion protein (multidrug efflux system)